MSWWVVPPFQENIKIPHFKNQEGCFLTSHHTPSLQIQQLKRFPHIFDDIVLPSAL